MNKYVHPSAVSSHVAHRTNGAQMLRDLLCTTCWSIGAAHLQCCIIFLSAAVLHPDHRQDGAHP